MLKYKVGVAETNLGGLEGTGIGREATFLVTFFSLQEVGSLRV